MMLIMADLSLAKDKFILNDIIKEDSKNLSRYVKPNSVALTITSPPYRNAINYSQHVSNLKSSSNVWMRGTGQQSTSHYLELMEEIFNQVFKVTKEGGFCCIIIGDEVVNGKLVPLPSLLLSRITSLENEDDPNKWRFRDMIIWNKTTSGRNGSGNRFGLFIQFPFPGYYRANIMHEYILILQKGLARKDIAKIAKHRIPLNRMLKREFANSIWNIPPLPPGSVKHPAPFPEQIPWRLVTLLSKKGDVVLDPMNGSGQTTKVAFNLGRKYVGIDIRNQYVNEAKKRLKQKLKQSNFLVPVYYPEVWSSEEELGYFETREVDLSKNLPAGYKFIFNTKSDRSTKGKKGIYAYYKSPKFNSYICFIMGANGKLSRINLGSIKDPKSMIHNVLFNLPKSSFIKADLNHVLETRIVENRQPIKACLDILLHFQMVKPEKKVGSSHPYKITEKGIRQREKLKQKPKNSIKQPQIIKAV